MQASTMAVVDTAPTGLVDRFAELLLSSGAPICCRAAAWPGCLS